MEKTSLTHIANVLENAGVAWTVALHFEMYYRTNAYFNHLDYADPLYEAHRAVLSAQRHAVRRAYKVLTPDQQRIANNLIASYNLPPF